MEPNMYKTPSRETHFLVSGGGKGITAECAVALASAFQSSFTLIGSSQLLNAEPDWAVGQDREKDLKKALLQFYQSKEIKLSPKEMDREVRQVLSSREINKTLNRITEAGGEAHYLQADITDREELEKQLDPYLSNINALVHGAGALADKHIEDKQESDYERVYGVKVKGLKNILSLLSPTQLDSIVLFSSVAGYYGNPGQSDYSLSNEILNKFAHHINHTQPSCRVLWV